MGLLDKFNAVEIKADNRISEADREYCTTLQAAYDKAKKQLNDVYTILIRVGNEQRQIMGDKAERMPRFLDGCSGLVSQVDDDIMNRHSRFINAIVSYFEREYTVNLDRSCICEHLIPKRPDSSRWDDSYKRDCEKYFQDIKSLSISYVNVIDEIYAQLDGFSFEERAVNELKKRCWEVVHPGRYYNDNPEDQFEVKGSTLQLTYGCSHSSWYSDTWELTETLRVVLNGIAHYFYGMMNYGSSMFPFASAYRVETDVFEYSRFVLRIKFYKNGRVDIKFADSKCLNEFVEQYLKTNAGGQNNDQ